MNPLREAAAEAIRELSEKTDWEPVEHQGPVPGGGLFFATHSSVVALGTATLRCYILSNGQRVFNLDDVSAFFLGTGVS